jgi:anti-sigma regulatory factor (Ser/Thr protein kinase)
MCTAARIPICTIRQRVLTLRLPPEPASATRARRVTRTHLAPVCPEDALDVAGLLVTELVSNAVLHAQTDMLLVVDVVPGRIELCVQDGSPDLPERKALDPQAATGRGLAIVEELATTWGVDHDRGQKVVWASIDFRPMEKAAQRTVR